MWDAIKFIAGLLVPPKGTTPEDSRWRWGIASITGGLFVVNAIHIAWACGLLATWGLPGFASADSVSDIKHEIQRLAAIEQQNITDIKVNQLDSKILDDRKRQCGLPKENGDARQLIADRIQWERDQYRSLTGSSYDLPSCDQF